MIILDKPYVSDFLKAEIAQHGWPVLDNAVTRDQLAPACCTLKDDAEFAALYKPDVSRLYCNSENSIGWIDTHLAHTPFPAMIALCKDKVAFRKCIASMYPDFYFREVAFTELDGVDPKALHLPCIIKPAVGFFSMGVHRVDTAAEWKDTLATIKAELKSVEGIYPGAVMDGSRFIIESCIEGEEYAVDAYYDDAGNPVVLNILHHVFASGKDVSDRVYSTSAAIMTRWLEPFTEFLAEMGKRAGLRNFPVHVELRVEAAGETKGRAVPIEINPMRFAGWCTTDVAYHAWGISPYAHYFNNRKPDWATLTRERAGRLWSIGIAELPAGIAATDVAAVDYDGLSGMFEKVCELRRIDWREYPVLAMIFLETREEAAAELDQFLRMDLSQFVRRR